VFYGVTRIEVSFVDKCLVVDTLGSPKYRRYGTYGYTCIKFDAIDRL